jgi:hypothetical protein
MRNADELGELNEQWRDLTGVMPSYRNLTGAGPEARWVIGSQPAGARAGRGRIRYAFGGAAPRGGEPWAADPAATAPHADLWVLVCGGIAAAAAFAAAFLASAGVGHAATPQAPAHNVSVQACPTAVSSR